MKQGVSFFEVFAYFIAGIFAFLCLYPFLLVIGGSFMTQSSFIHNGLQLIPSEVTLDAYRTILRTSDRIIRSYGVTIFVTVVGTASALLVNSMAAFGLSRRELIGRRILNFYVLFPMLFSGGMVSWYIVCVNILQISDSIYALILPMMANPWNIFMIRIYFYRSIPESLYEAAKIDGASNIRIFFTLYLPLSKPILATISLFGGLAYWNDWFNALMLVRRDDLQPLQMFLRRIISNVQFLRSMDPTPEMQHLYASLPGEGLKMAMVIITIGPMILFYPFIQRYFVKGIMIGSVKG